MRKLKQFAQSRYLILGLVCSLFAGTFILLLKNTDSTMSDIYRAQAKASAEILRASELACGAMDELLTERAQDFSDWNDYAEIAGMKWRCSQGEILGEMDVHVITFFADDRPEDQVQKDLDQLIANNFQ